jgi:hypothetical protein
MAEGLNSNQNEGVDASRENNMMGEQNSQPELDSNGNLQNQGN